MKHKIILTLLTLLTYIVPVMADWNLENGKTYYLCNKTGKGFVGISSRQGITDGYLLYQQDRITNPTSDAYWYIIPSGTGYALRNAETEQYLSWSNDYERLRNLTFVNQLSNDEQRWYLMDNGSGGIVIRSVAHPQYCLNLRNYTNHIALYQSNIVQDNSIFYILDQEGKPLSYTNTPIPDKDPDPDEDIQPDNNIYQPHGKKMIYLRHRDSTVTVLPIDYVKSYTYSGSLFTATLSNQEQLKLKGIESADTLRPTDLPGFTSYKFNKKYNHQVFITSEAKHPTQDSIDLSVSGIGKWLCASFQLHDPQTDVRIGKKRQQSKITRHSFAQPVTYSFNNPKWTIIKLKQQPDGTIVQQSIPYSRTQTISVHFLTDHSTQDYTVPRIDITLNNNNAWGYNNWIGKLGKSTYITAQISINGGGAFPNMAATPILIKGRGNTSWSNNYTSKNPYHFKFETKQQPLGMKAGKHWILLANKQEGSMTTNAMGMKIAAMMGTAGANHIIPVELYINGSYRGSYNLTERVGFSNNSLDIEDESLAAMIEMDTYTDEKIYRTNAYKLDSKIHIPDIANNETILKENNIIGDFDKMTQAVATGTDDYTKYVDIPYLVSYLSANELIVNCELGHPKSVFLYSENVLDTPNEKGIDPTPWIFGPLWDCDWAFGYQNSYSYYNSNATDNYFATQLIYGQGQERAKAFWNNLRYNSREVDSTYYQLWKGLIENGLVQELKDYAQEYYNYAAKSFEHNKNNQTSNQDFSNYAEITEQSKRWLEQRIQSIYSRLVPYAAHTPDSPTHTQTQHDNMGDVNNDGVLSSADVVTLLNALLELPNDTYYPGRADIDSNGRISIGDVVQLCQLILQQPTNARLCRRSPQASATLNLSKATLKEQTTNLLPLNLSIEEDAYSALQFDLHLPPTIELDGIELSSDMHHMTVHTQQRTDGSYRLILYTDGSTPLLPGNYQLQLRLVTGQPTEGYIQLNAINLSTEQGEEEHLGTIARPIRVQSNTPTGQTNIPTTAIHKQPIFDLSGRCISPNNLNHGIYIQGGKKYVK